MENSSDTDRDLLSLLFMEAEAYKGHYNLEALLESNEKLDNLPVQPMYLATKKCTSDQLALLVEKLSSAQRQYFIDIDLWQKDHLDVASFERWITSYLKCKDEQIVEDFISGESFLLYLKGRFDIKTFDVEDPMYPDHDQYFLTDDGLLLFEYEEDYPYVDQIKNLLRHLYSRWGVERAYAHIFKIVSDCYANVEEAGYQFKKSRLEDIGIVDYYESLKLLANFPSMSHVNSFIKNKKELTAELDSVQKLQRLHANQIVPFRKGFDKIHTGLSKIKDSDRSYYLQFNFIRLVNSVLAFEGALKESSLTMNRHGVEVSNSLKLGFEYIDFYLQYSNANLPEQGIFALFDFSEIYKVGKSIVAISQRKLKAKLRKFGFEELGEQKFFGVHLNKTLEEALDGPGHYSKGLDEKKVSLEKLEDFHQWEKEIEFLIRLIPYIQSFHQSYSQLVEGEYLQDQFYLNYNVAEIDFESIILSSLINYSLGSLQNEEKKMGVTKSELTSFWNRFFDCEGKTQFNENTDEFQKMTDEFISTFGFAEIPGLPSFLQKIVSWHLSGYDISELKGDEYQHVGGPILLQS
ncbi:MAG: hypothetical protein HOE90_18080 [Bacteriovoracaceae bacterium]|nr:hypothetical protein [Bacteriovoracaceae bacterium]